MTPLASRWAGMNDAFGVPQPPALPRPSLYQFPMGSGGITHSRLTSAPSDGERVAERRIPLAGRRPGSYQPRATPWVHGAIDVLLQANGLPHPFRRLHLNQRSLCNKPRRRLGGRGNAKDESRLQRSGGFWADEPRALPWAGMNDAFGVPQPPALPRPSLCQFPVLKGLCNPAQGWSVPSFSILHSALFIPFRAYPGESFSPRTGRISALIRVHLYCQPSKCSQPAQIRFAICHLPSSDLRLRLCRAVSTVVAQF